MKQVRIFKPEVQEALTVNRAKHKSDYDTALANWREELKNDLNKVLARVDEPDFEVDEVYAAAQTKPVSYLKDYDRALKMVEMCIDDTITLEKDEFANYVMDDWGWKEQWSASNSKYLSNNRR